MDENDRQSLVGRVAEAHADVSEVAFKLRRELPLKSPVVKAAVKVERELFSAQAANCSSSTWRTHRRGSH